MTRALVLVALTATSCLDFDKRIADCEAGLGSCRVDGGAPPDDAGLEDAGAPQDSGTPADAGALSDAGRPCPGFSHDGWCWVNPLPHGDGMVALSATAQNDVWALGGAGHFSHFDGVTWTDHRLVELLGREGDLRSMASVPGGFVAVGDDVGPTRFRFDGGWSPITPVTHLLEAVVVTATGVVIAVGTTNGGGVIVSGPPEGPFVDTTRPTYTGFSHVTSTSAGLFITGAASGSRVLLGPDGGERLNIPGQGQALASLFVHDEQLWCGAAAGQLFSTDLRTLVTDAGSIGPIGAVSAVATGAVLPDGTFVVGGSNEVIAEGRPGANFTNRFPTSTPFHPTIYVRAVVSAGDAGWAMAVGAAGQRFVRQGQWRWAGSALGGNVFTGFAIDGGLFFAGQGWETGTVRNDDWAITLFEDPRQNDTWSLSWSDGDAGWLADSRRVCRVNGTKCGTPRDAGFAPIAIGGSSQDNLWVVGDQGHLTQLQRNGTSVDHSLQGSNLPSFQAVVAFGEAALAFGKTGPGASRAWLLSSDGGVERYSRYEPLAADELEVYAAVRAPDGVVWFGGSNDSRSLARTYKLFPDGRLEGPATLEDTSGRVGAIASMVAAGPDDVWMLTGDGALWHATTGTIGFVETGSRAPFRHLILSEGPAGRTLWLVGMEGTLLAKRLP